MILGLFVFVGRISVVVFAVVKVCFIIKQPVVLSVSATRLTPCTATCHAPAAAQNDQNDYNDDNNTHANNHPSEPVQLGIRAICSPVGVFYYLCFFVQQISKGRDVAIGNVFDCCEDTYQAAVYARVAYLEAHSVVGACL